MSKHTLLWSGCLLLVFVLCSSTFAFEQADDSSFPLVSLIIPTYERREFLAKSLEFVERQDYPNLEVVIVDDSKEPLAEDARRTPTV